MPREIIAASAGAREPPHDLEAALAAKNAFIAHALHDLQGPAGVIQSLAALLRRGSFGELDEEQRAAVVDIERSATFLVDLARNAADLARISDGTFALQPELVDLDALATKVVDALGSVARARSITVRLEIAGDASGTWLDPFRLRQVLYNYLLNAITFTPEGGTVAVRLLGHENGLRIEVSDTGIGIAAADLERLYDEFNAVDAGKMREVQGAGLGLAVTRAIVETHGGRVGAESSPGIGSVFWAELPRIAPPAPRPDREHLDGGITDVRVQIHDLNNSLAMVRMYAQFALEKPDEGERLRDDLAVVLDAAERAIAVAAELSTSAEKRA